MHYLTGSEYETDHRLLLTSEDGSRRTVDLSAHLEGDGRKGGDTVKTEDMSRIKPPMRWLLMSKAV